MTKDVKDVISPYKFRNQNDGLNVVMSNATALDFLVVNADGKLVPELTRTQQNFADDCDINRQVEMFMRSGVLPHGNANTPRFGNFIDAPDFQEAMQTVIDAQAAFSNLDAKTRKRFGNDPAEYLAFLADPENEEEAIKLGMAIRPPAPEPLPIARQAPSGDGKRSSRTHAGAKPAVDDSAPQGDE